jgi:hypothetical protein
MAGPFIECRIDTTDLMRAQAIFFEFAKTVPALAINRTVLFIVKAAQRETTVTSLSRIDTELAVEVTPRIGKRGQPTKRNVIAPRKGIGVMRGGRVVPLAALIINARVLMGGGRAGMLHAGGLSRYNRLTGMRYARTVSPFYGKSRAAGAQAMTDAISRMVKARHSGRGFFQQAWGAIIAKLIPHVPAAYRRGFGSQIGRRTNQELGAVTPAVVGTMSPSCTIELRIGMGGAKTNPTLNAARNQAMHRILGPTLQSAIDREYVSKMIEAERQGWLERAPRLRALGWEVSF